MPDNAAKVILVVAAGIIPGTADTERRWSLTAEELEDELTVATRLGASLEYAAMLRNPHRYNWVTHEWVWT